MNDFRDAIAAARVWMPGVDAQDYHCGVDMADEILAMPEMRAIRDALYHAYARPYVETLPQSAALNTARNRMKDGGLPDSVIDWVLS